MSQYDPGDTTDSVSTSGSGSNSDWALVDEYGMLQDNDTESTGSSVEIMDGEDEEDADHITPLAGNSPGENTLQPRFVLRLSNHEVSDTDDEPGVGTGEIVTDSSMSDIISLTSSEMPVSLSTQDIMCAGTPDLLETGTQDSVQTRTLDSLHTGTQDSVQTGTQDLLQTGTVESLQTDTETKSTIPPVAVSKGQQISPEHIESLRRAIDDVQSNLLYSPSASSSMSSYEMFGDVNHDSGAMDKEVTTQAILPPSDQLHDISSKGDQRTHDSNQSDTGVISLECVNQGDSAGLDDSHPEEQPEGTVACVPSSTAVETLGPDMPDLRPLMQRMVFKQARGSCVKWWCGFLEEHWFLSSYVFFLSVVVLVTGFNVYYAFSAIDVVNPYTGKTVPVPGCVSYEEMQKVLEDHRQELRERNQVIKELKADLVERHRQYEIVSLHRDTVVEENTNLHNQIKAMQEEVYPYTVGSEELEGDTLLEEEIPQNPPDECGFLVRSRGSAVLSQEAPSGSAVLSQDAPSKEPVDKPDRHTLGKSKDMSAEINPTGKELTEEDQGKRDLQITKTEIDKIRNTVRENNERPEKKGMDKRKDKETKKKQENEKINPENGRRRQARKEKDQNEQKRKEKRRNEKKQADEEKSDSSTTGSVWMDNIFDIMNKTKGQIEETWHQVRNISDHLWKKHSPTLERMTDKFQKKFEHLSNKFQQKLMKKTSKWFGKWRKSCNKNNAEKEENASAKAETKRRPFKDEEPSVIKGKTKGSNKAEFGGKTAGHTRCDHRVMDLNTRIKLLSISKLERMTDKRKSKLVAEMRNTLAALLQDGTIHDIHVQTEWLKCQATWWQDSDDLTVGSGCERYLCCWQVKLAGGDAKGCRRIKLDEGNVLDNRCAVGPGPVDYKQAGLEDSSEGEHVEDDHYDDDDDDDLWYVGRAEDRQYHRDEPDDWFFRRSKDHLYSQTEDDDEEEMYGRKRYHFEP